MAEVIDARMEARERVAGRFDVRVLEPSPPRSTAPPWFADDPVNAPTLGTLPVVSPVRSGDLTWDELARQEPELTDWCADRWLGSWRPLAPIDDLATFSHTCDAWHAIAEHVLAPARHRANGKIGLRFTLGGFGTPFFLADDRDAQVRVDGTDIVAVFGGGTTRAPVSVLASDADARNALVDPFVGEDLGYPMTTSFTADALDGIDAKATQELSEWFGFACSVLEELRATAPDAARTRVQLWPEHFDMSIDLGDDHAGKRGTFGASPGDAAHPEPYLYVTHWADVPPDPFWNDTEFGGASLGYTDLVQHADQRGAALTFLGAGRGILGGAGR